MSIDLFDHQLQAVDEMHNGCILVGGVGTGKSRTALAYYYIKECKGSLVINGKGSLGRMKAPKDLYIITTAKKRDSKEWLFEAGDFLISEDKKDSFDDVKVTVDSWNNISKYRNVYNAFFIFDEQRVVGKGAWVKNFIRITKRNRWVLLSATPGDTWLDYIPVFVANGFYYNRTDFIKQHVIYNRYAKFPKVDKYVNTGKLIKERAAVLVPMKFSNIAEQHHIHISAQYDKTMYGIVARKRWDPYLNEPVKETGKLCYLLRRVVNSDSSRIEEVRVLIFSIPRAIIFYNFDYELEILRQLCSELMVPYAEWNGQKHQSIPDEDRWVYLVQYTAGAEGWNCTLTDSIIFYSQNYSYRVMVQAAGRIDRMNTPYKDLYYYHVKSKAPIDVAIAAALNKKKNFNERSFIK